MMELKPCPFCGSEDIYETYSQEYALGTKNPEIFCNTCKAIFAVEDDSPYMNCDEDFKYRREKTTEAWNRRTVKESKTGRWVFCDSDAERYDDIRCSVCGKHFTVDAERWCDIGLTASDLKHCPNCGAKME